MIDPQRDVEIYLDAALRHGVQISHVIETHVHADFVPGHCELAESTGARIISAKAPARILVHTAVKDGNAYEFGNCRLEFLQSPGHTLESICIVITDKAPPGVGGRRFSVNTV